MDGAAGDGGLPRGYHYFGRDYLRLSLRVGGLSWRTKEESSPGVSAAGLNLGAMVVAHRRTGLFDVGFFLLPAEG